MKQINKHPIFGHFEITGIGEYNFCANYFVFSWSVDL